MEDRLYVAEIHQFKLKGKKFIFDVNTSRLFNVDNLVYDILGIANEQNAKTIIGSLQPQYPGEEIETALDELKEMRLIQAEPFKYPKLQDSLKGEHPLHSLDFIVSQDCNMRCRYCFAATGSYKMERALMDVTVAKKAVDFLIARSGENKKLHITFFGGEPLLNVPVIKETIEYGAKQAQEADKELGFNISCNGTLLTEDLIHYFHNPTLPCQYVKFILNSTRQNNKGHYGF